MILLMGLGLLYGCDPGTRHRVLSTVFDGVPAPPNPDDICADYGDTKKSTALQGEGEGPAVTGSNHKPYTEKRCSDCHAQSKTENGGLIHPRQELCLVCHDTIISGTFVHGPVAVGDCLACHLPHSSSNLFLLRQQPEKICQSCHREERLAATMHQKVSDRSMACGDCHDPHSGQARYFLR
ncbi:cytochrome c3 family protein [Desulfuromonas sp. AOP6]|uniref:cytochrome c3 family protein n=1 Tax=Desulfuromonas sp. AOP6 TaxID=1566351 RepID=UPI001CEC1F93|nr:cytochrome c3 family protein [Desulfuromonas sp. AOP6]